MLVKHTKKIIFDNNDEPTYDTMIEFTKFMTDQDKIAFVIFFKYVYPNELIYDSKIKQWYSANEYGIFMNDGSHRFSIKDRIDEACKILKKCMKHYVKNNESNVSKKEIVKFNRVIIKLRADSCARGIIKMLENFYDVENININTNEYLFPFNNGVYDLETFTFRHADIEEFVFGSTGYEYVPSQKKHRKFVKKILRSIFATEKIYNYFLTIVSLRLVRTTQSGEIYFLIGDSPSGKGVIVNFLQDTFGDFSDMPDERYICGHSKLPHFIRNKKYDGSTVAFIHELDPDSKISAANIKKLSDYTLFFQSVFEPKINNNCSDMSDLYDKIRIIPLDFIFVDTPKRPNEKLINREIKTMFESNRYKCAFIDILVKAYSNYIQSNNIINMPKEVLTRSKKYVNDLSRSKHVRILTN